MELFGETIDFGLLVFTALGSGFGVAFILLKRAQEWLYEHKLGDKRSSLPPGDLGWPLVGNMLSFLNDFKSRDPDQFINSYIKRFGKTGIYKAFMFGNPTVLLIAPEFCKQVLMDDKRFGQGWPKSTVKLMGRKSFMNISFEEHKRLRKLTAASINGHEALSAYLEFIEETVMSTIGEWCDMGEIEFLTQIRKLTFRIIMHSFLGKGGDHMMEAIEKEYTTFNCGIRSMAINVPGFAYSKALKARKRLVEIFQGVANERRARRETYGNPATKDMMDNLMDIEDENSRKLSDEEIIDILILYLNAGHESSAHIAMWATILLQENPDILQSAKAEQEEIIKKRSPTQKGLTLREVKQMWYLSNVIDETLRIINISLMVFREAKNDVNMNGYLIPKGWKIQIWLRNVNLDPDLYSDPKKFDPSRWNGKKAKAGTYLPFGAGSRLCPGSDLAKLEISVFLHYFLLYYRVERLNPQCPIAYLPHTKPKDNCLATFRKI